MPYRHGGRHGKDTLLSTGAGVPSGARARGHDLAVQAGAARPRPLGDYRAELRPRAAPGGTIHSELARRATAPENEIDVIIQTRRDQSDLLAHIPGMRTAPAAPWTAAVIPDTAVRPSIGDLEARTLENEIADGSDAILEQKYPLLLEYYRANGVGLAAARLAFKVLQIYNRRGYYHEAKSFIEDILPCIDDLVQGEEFRRMNSVSEMNSCLVATGDAARALRIVTDLAVPHITKPHLLANMNYILGMHHLRYLKSRDIERAERYILQAVDNIRAAKDRPEANEHAFLKAFIDNGLAFLRVPAEATSGGARSMPIRISIRDK